MITTTEYTQVQLQARHTKIHNQIILHLGYHPISIFNSKSKPNADVGSGAAPRRGCREQKCPNADAEATDLKMIPRYQLDVSDIDNINIF